MDGNDSSAFWKERLLERVAEDHRRFEEAAVEVEAMGEPDGLGAFDGLVSRACDELLIHAQLEDEILYPAFRAVMPLTRLIDEAVIEHANLQILIEAVRSFGPDDEQYLSAFTVLAKFVRVHVDAEENEVFPALESAVADWKGLLRQWCERRAALCAEKGLETPDDELEAQPDQV